MALEKKSLSILLEAFDKLHSGFNMLPQIEYGEDLSPMQNALLETAGRLKDNYPYFHPLYAGQMLKPPHPVARLAYMLALWINPNNHALDGGRASSAMEKESVAQIAQMFGWDSYLGHLTGGGTMANLEALWVAGQIHPGKTLLASDQAHYTHKRISAVLGLQCETIPTDSFGRMDMNQLHDRIKKGNIGTVVATMGTTAIGSVDPLKEILELQKQFGFRIHADAAYGGYFSLVDSLPEKTKEAYALLREADSIVIDPHKHGLQPYGCGCILFKDPSVGTLYKHDSPYTYFSSNELHLGEISLECSRPGAAAVALWTTMKMFPLIHAGEFAQALGKSHSAAMKLYHYLQNDNRFITAFPPELDIVVWIPRTESVSKTSALSHKIFEETAMRNLHLALAELPVDFFSLDKTGMELDKNTVTCLRSVLMKPEHLEWMDRIWEIIMQSTDSAISR